MTVHQLPLVSAEVLTCFQVTHVPWHMGNGEDTLDGPSAIFVLLTHTRWPFTGFIWIFGDGGDRRVDGIATPTSYAYVLA